MASGQSRGARGKAAPGGLDGGSQPGEAAAAAPQQGAGFLARARNAYEAHPLLVTWAALAVGMVAILLWASRDVDLLPHQRLVLVLATVALAGLCAWIIGWEGQG